MKPGREEWYIGIEAGKRFTQISCYHVGQAEPETKSTLAGSELYQIPTAVCKRKQNGKWCIGEEAKKLAEREEGYYANELLSLAFSKKTIFLDVAYPAQELYLIFLRKVLRLALPPQGVEAVTKCIFTLDRITEETPAFVLEMAMKLGLKEQQIQIQDHRESFYAYVVFQELTLWKHQVMLFEEEGNGVICRLLSCDPKTRPKVAKVAEAFLGKLPEDKEERDRAFQEMLTQVLAGRVVSSIYLIGDGFEGDWMEDSLKLVCRGRRAFQGKNLYTKGACYAGLLQVHQEEAETVYFCEYKVKEHVSLKVSRQDETFFYPLAEAGCNHHQIGKEIRILLEGEPALELWFQMPGSKEARIESLELSGLLVSEWERSRLKISVSPGQAGCILLHVKDLGLGDLKPGTGLEWEYEIGKEQS